MADTVDQAFEELRAAYEAVLPVGQDTYATVESVIGEKDALIADLQRQLADCQASGGGGGEPEWWPADSDTHIRLTTLGLTLDGDGLRQASTHPNANNKILLVPEGRYELDGYKVGDQASRFVAGIMLNKDLNANAFAGIVGAGVGKTIIGMKAGSSQFRDEASANKPDQSYNYVATIHWYQKPCKELSHFTLEGADFPHFYNGILVNGGSGTYIHDMEFIGAARGGWNMPPAETYPLGLNGVSEPRVVDVYFDGVSPNSPDGQPWSSTAIGFNGATMTEGKGEFTRVVGRNLISGFLGVSYKSTGTITTDCVMDLPGIFAHGLNGCFWNHELSKGRIRHYRPVINLDAIWGPTDRPAKTAERPFARRRVSQALVKKYVRNTDATKYINSWANPQGDTCDDVGKFGHMTFWNTGEVTAYKDAEIHDPVFDSWGEKVGSFAITCDSKTSGGITTMPKLFIGGVQRTAVERYQWGNDKDASGNTIPFDPARNYWVVRDSWG